MNIKKINLLRLWNDAHFQFHTTFRDLVLTRGVAVLKVLHWWTLYLMRYDREEEALKEIAASDTARRLVEADAARDDAFAGLAKAVRAACRHFIPARRAAALRVRAVFDAYGDVARKPINEETSAVRNLVREITGAKYAEDARAIDVYDWALELERRNNAFDALMKRRFEETGDRRGIDLKAERAALDKVYKQITARINALVEVEGEEGYKAFVGTMNAVIATYKAKARRRGAARRDGGEGAGAAEGGGDA